jgi:hypothetical protein
MNTLTLIVLVLVGAGAQASPAQDAGQLPGVLGDGSYELEDVVVIASRPGLDPSAATTQCLWDHLPPDQRAALAAGADHAVRTLAHHDDLPLANRALTDAAVTASLRACGGSDKPAALPFARTALFAFAAENSTAARLAGDRLHAPRLQRGWATLSPAQREVVLRASVLEEDDVPEEIGDELFSALFKLLRNVRPVGVWNPLAYRNGTATHRVVYYYQAHAVRTLMERRF